MTDYSGVSDTLFIPLAGRIFISKKFPEYFYDETALSLENELPVKDIMERSSVYTMLSPCARYYNFDKITRDFLKRKGPGVNVVNIGAGLETARDRIPDAGITYYEIDLPDVIKLREEVLPARDNQVLIAADAFEGSWTESVDTSKPTLVIASGIFQYFHKEKIIPLIKLISEKIPGAELVFDATNTKGLKYCEKYVKKTGNTEAAMYFAVDNPEDFAEECGMKLMGWYNFYEDARVILKKKADLYSRIAMKVCDKDGRAIILHLQL